MLQSTSERSDVWYVLPHAGCLAVLCAGPGAHASTGLLTAGIVLKRSWPAVSQICSLIYFVVQQNFIDLEVDPAGAHQQISHPSRIKCCLRARKARCIQTAVSMKEQ